MPKKILLLALVFLIGFSLFLFKRTGNNQPQNKICFNEQCFYVELAKTSQEQSQGLMFEKQIEPDKGMLFIFKEEKEHQFWMKNTLTSLDIIWINKDKKVVFIKKEAKVCEKEVCELIVPDKKAKYVLELNAGTTDKIQLKVGDSLIFYIDN